MAWLKLFVHLFQIEAWKVNLKFPWGYLIVHGAREACGAKSKLIHI